MLGRNADTYKPPQKSTFCLLRHLTMVLNLLWTFIETNSAFLLFKQLQCSDLRTEEGCKLFESNARWSNAKTGTDVEQLWDHHRRGTNFVSERSHGHFICPCSHLFIEIIGRANSFFFFFWNKQIRRECRLLCAVPGCGKFTVDKVWEAAATVG